MRTLSNMVRSMLTLRTSSQTFSVVHGKKSTNSTKRFRQRLLPGARMSRNNSVRWSRRAEISVSAQFRRWYLAVSREWMPSKRSVMSILTTAPLLMTLWTLKISLNTPPSTMVMVTGKPMRACTSNWVRNLPSTPTLLWEEMLARLTWFHLSLKCTNWWSKLSSTQQLMASKLIPSQLTKTILYLNISTIRSLSSRVTLTHTLRKPWPKRMARRRSEVTQTQQNDTSRKV